jgi:hypothetical protein
MSRSLALAAGVAAVLIASGAQAQVRTVSIGRITSQKACTVYQESAGRSSLVATPYAVAASESWRTWLVKDCVDNFATMRTSLEAALAATGKFAVKTKGAGYSLAGAVSDVGMDGDPAARPPSSTGGYSVASSGMFVSMDVTLRDASGRTIYGGLLTKHLETGSNIHTPGFDTSASQSGAGVYAELQHQMALAVARLVAFHIEPLRVTGAEGRQIRLNYGAPLLSLGMIIHANSPDGGPPVRYRVVSANTDAAFAELDSEGNASRITSGSTATVVEADDPAANERKIQRVDLP